MGNKKFLIILMGSFLIIFIIIQVLVNVVVDPDMETRLFNHRLNRYKFSHTAVSGAHNFEKLKSEKAILVFGTSRSHMIKNEDFGKTVLNMHSIYGSPYSVYSFLTQLNRVQLENIDTIYYLIDDLTFNKKSVYEYVNFNSHFFKILSIVKSTNIKKIFRALNTIKRNKGEVKSFINQNGSLIFNEKLPVFDPSNRNHTDPSEIVVRRQLFSEDTFAELGNIDKFVKLNKLKIIYFSAPLTVEYIQAMDFKLFVGQKERFLNQLDGYYDLTYVEGLSNKNEMFTDFSHTNDVGKEKYLSILKSEDQNYFVTKDRFEALKQKIKNINSPISE